MQSPVQTVSDASHPSQAASHSSGRWTRLGRDPVWTWTVLFLLFTALGLLKFSYFYFDDLARERPGTALWRGVQELTGTYTAFVLLPLIVLFARRFTWSRTHWIRFFAGHLSGAICYSLAHTTLMALSRAAIFPLLGLGRYDYGVMVFRYPMEFSGDLSGYAIIVGFFYFFRRLREAQQHEIVAAQLEARLAEAQLENLRLQLNPHFLFNTLNMISSVMYEDVETADAMIVRLSDLLRFTLRAESKPEIRFAEELEITRLYLEIMKARFEDKLYVNYEVDTGVQEALIPQLILQPLVENAVRHGMNEESGLQINLKAARENNDLVIHISDNGPGIAESHQGVDSKRGIGLANTKARLEQLYGQEQRFEIASETGSGTDVTVALPFHTVRAAAS
jgi:two-component system, LytTR family, sensor kinase